MEMVTPPKQNSACMAETAETPVQSPPCEKKSQLANNYGSCCNARQWLSKSSDLSPPCDYHHITVMPVELKGSCHCGAVAFTVQSSTPVPYQLCMCSICRKVGGTGGSVNLGAHAHTLQITKGKADISCGFISFTLRCSYMSLSVRGGTGYIKQC